jgi:hypothetical protein
MTLLKTIRLINEIKIKQFKLVTIMKKVNHFFASRAVYALLPVLLLLNSCSKKSDPDPRDNWVGKWAEVEYNGKAATDFIMTIEKGTATKVISMDWWYNYGGQKGIRIPDDATLSVDGTSFTFDQASYVADTDFTATSGTHYKIEYYNIVGKMSGSNLTLSWDIKFTNKTTNAVSRFTGSDGFTEKFTKK